MKLSIMIPKDFSCHHPFSSSITEYFPFDEQTCVMKFGKFPKNFHDVARNERKYFCWVLTSKMLGKILSHPINMCDMLFTVEEEKL